MDLLTEKFDIEPNFQTVFLSTLQLCLVLNLQRFKALAGFQACSRGTRRSRRPQVCNLRPAAPQIQKIH